MRIVKTAVLAAAVVAFTAPALACGGMKGKTAQTTIDSNGGPQTTVKQTASKPSK